MSTDESGKPVKSLLAEYIDGGPGCIRDDCVLIETVGKSFFNSDVTVHAEITKRCTSCGKSWTERYQSGIRIS